MLQARDLTKRYGAFLALDRVHFAVERGEILGYLGPNGSGKTTTIRCLLGLVRPTAGRLTVLGTPVPGDLASAIGRIGTVVESSAFFPTMSVVTTALT